MSGASRWAAFPGEQLHHASDVVVEISPALPEDGLVSPLMARVHDAGIQRQGHREAWTAAVSWVCPLGAEAARRASSRAPAGGPRGVMASESSVEQQTRVCHSLIHAHIHSFTNVLHALGVQCGLMQTGFFTDGASRRDRQMDDIPQLTSAMKM